MTSDIQEIAQANGLRYLQVESGGEVKHLLLPDGLGGNPLVNLVISEMLNAQHTQTEIARILGLHRTEVVRRSRAMGFSLKRGRRK